MGRAIIPTLIPDHVMENYLANEGVMHKDHSVDATWFSLKNSLLHFLCEALASKHQFGWCYCQASESVHLSSPNGVLSQEYFDRTLCATSWPLWHPRWKLISFWGLSYFYFAYVVSVNNYIHGYASLVGTILFVFCSSNSTQLYDPL